MKNCIIIVLIAIALFISGTGIAQERYYRGPKSEKKEWKMHKKESKIGRKMFRDRPNSASRKKQKARKKAYKMMVKEDMGR